MVFATPIKDMREAPKEAEAVGRAALAALGR